jgi:hypothetical protein
MSKSSNEETSEPLIADARNYYKVEKSTKDGTKVDPCFPIFWLCPMRLGSGFGLSRAKARGSSRLAIRRPYSRSHMLYAGSSLDKAREVFAAAIYHRPRIRLTIRQQTRMLKQWPTPPPSGAS